MVLVRKILKYSSGRKSRCDPLGIGCSGICRGDFFINKREFFLCYHIKTKLGVGKGNKAYGQGRFVKGQLRSTVKRGT